MCAPTCRSLFPNLEKDEAPSPRVLQPGCLGAWKPWDGPHVLPKNTQDRIRKCLHNTQNKGGKTAIRGSVLVSGCFRAFEGLALGSRVAGVIT